MPNWKKIALSGSNPEFSSVNVDNSVSAGSLTGSIDFNNLTNSPTLVSSSAQIASDISGSFTSTSASIATDIASLVTDSGSFSTRVTAIEGFSSSIESSIYSYTGSFTGDGSGLTGVQTELTEQVTLVDSFTLATTHSISHTFETKNLNVTLYDENDDIFIPSRINTPNTSSVVIYMDPATTGRVVISKGGHLVSGSVAREVVETQTVSDTFTLATTHSVSHAFGTKDVFVTLYDDNDEQFIPSKIATPTTSSVVVYMDPASTGRVVVAKGGHLVSGSVAIDPNYLSVSSSILPHTTEVFDLGSSDKRWRDLYLSGSTIDLGGTKITRTATGDIEFKDGGGTRKSIQVDELQIGVGASARKIKVNNGRIQFTNDSNTVESSETAHVIPESTNAYDLGSPTKQFRHLYLSSASLYIDGNKILSSNAEVLTFTTDVGQSIKLLETGADDIILQTDTGNIELKGTVEILTGKKITDSAGTQVVFGDGIYVEGNIATTGTVDGIDLRAFSSSVATGLANASSDWDSVSSKPAGLVSSSAQTIANLTGTGIISGALSYYTDSDTLSYINSLGVVSGSITHYTDSDTLSYINGLGVISSSNQITITESQISDLTHYADSDVLTYINSLGVVSGSVASDWDSVSSKPAGIVSSSAQTIANLTGTNIISGSETLFSQSFSSATAVTASHGFGTKDVVVYIYDSNDNLIWPSNIKTATTNDVYVQFNTSRSGRVVVSKGGHLVDGTNQNAVSASYIPASGVVGTVTQASSVTENRAGGTLDFWSGTQAQYDALGSYSNSTIYFVE